MITTGVISVKNGGGGGTINSPEWLRMLRQPLRSNHMLPRVAGAASRASGGRKDTVTADGEVCDFGWTLKASASPIDSPSSRPAFTLRFRMSPE